MNFCRWRHPARVYVQLCDLMIVLVKEGHQVHRQIVQIFVGEAANDTAVDGDILWA